MHIYAHRCVRCHHSVQKTPFPHLLEIPKDMPSYTISPEKVQQFVPATSCWSIGLFFTVVLGPFLVRHILRRGKRPSRQQQNPNSTASIPTVEDEKLALPLDENPDYHGINYAPPVNTFSLPLLGQRTAPQSPDREMPPCTCCPAVTNPGKESGGSAGGTREIRRSPFNPIVPGMKTILQEGTDPVTGRRWKRRLVVYAGDLAPETSMLANEPGEVRATAAP